ncbi:hypothetical protein SKAU_G00225260 [Synaphobranchus kaupii]|uniref:CUB domain-containing protein n=1 Tax=Synaphobranchus kaupii TaxID=118154 RepID=A0A9Q1FBW0_SYNKA|nr:hypothetical protein SKAU_G00225260 [Synaphobranchus kaupii]
MARIHAVIWLLCVHECWGLAIPRDSSEGRVAWGTAVAPCTPNRTPASLSQQWDLSVPEGYRIKLTFFTLDVESSPNCYYDSVTVMYKAKELRENIGFSAFYQAIDVDECALPVPDDGSGPLCSQICHNTLGSYLCSCNHGYVLRPDQRTCD